MVEITQADREAAASVAVLVEIRELILAGKADRHAKPWARHREAGRRAGLEEAARIAGKYDCRGNNDSARNMAAIIRNAIRAKIRDGHE